VDALGQWNLNRVLTLPAKNFDVVAQRHPPWVAWRRNGSHVVAYHQANEADSGHLSTQLLISSQAVVRWAEPAYYRWIVSRRAADLLEAQEAIEVLLQRSQPSFPVTTLGI
jgi:hypothetical protein